MDTVEATLQAGEYVFTKAAILKRSIEALGNEEVRRRIQQIRTDRLKDGEQPES